MEYVQEWFGGLKRNFTTFSKFSMPIVGCNMDEELLMRLSHLFNYPVFPLI